MDMLNLRDFDQKIISLKIINQYSLGLYIGQIHYV